MVGLVQYEVPNRASTRESHSVYASYVTSPVEGASRWLLGHSIPSPVRNKQRRRQTYLQHISFAKVPEVMQPHQMGGCLLHGRHIQGVVLHKEVLVLPAVAAEPV